jgi:prevent-host-death family protein
MTHVSTRVLKNELSAWVHRAEQGERVIVLRDGVPVAALVPLSDLPERDATTRLRELAAQGVVRLPRQNHESPVWERWSRFASPGVPLSEQVLADRGAREDLL